MNQPSIASFLVQQRNYKHMTSKSWYHLSPSLKLLQRILVLMCWSTIISVLMCRSIVLSDFWKWFLLSPSSQLLRSISLLMCRSTLFENLWFDVSINVFSDLSEFVKLISFVSVFAAGAVEYHFWCVVQFVLSDFWNSFLLSPSSQLLPRISVLMRRPSHLSDFVKLDQLIFLILWNWFLSSPSSDLLQRISILICRSIVLSDFVNLIFMFPSYQLLRRI
jgi:hypothetical protein